MVNPQIKLLSEEYGYPLEKVIHFHFLMEFKDEVPILESYLLDGDKSIFPYELFQEYQINFCQVDTNDGVLKTKFPLYVTHAEDNLWESFRTLLMDKGMTGRGHANRKLDRSIFSKENLEFKQLERLNREIDKFDLEKAAQVIVDYYLTTEYPLNMDKYLGSENFKTDYESF
jgi:hypothetical protein